MKNISIIALFVLFTSLGCAHCGPKSGDEPNIRTMPGIEYCGAMCKKFEDLKCTGYYEPIEIDCSSDPSYMDMKECQVDGGIVNILCTSFCEYEMRNSVQLDPRCLSENLAVCSEIETLCNPFK